MDGELSWRMIDLFHKNCRAVGNEMGLTDIRLIRWKKGFVQSNVDTHVS